MRAVVQRVSEAAVHIDGESVGSIGRGYLVLLGVSAADTEVAAEKLWGKLGTLRINDDENRKTNLSLADVNGEVLVVSQFTPRVIRRTPNGSTSISSAWCARTCRMWQRAGLGPTCR